MKLCKLSNDKSMGAMQLYKRKANFINKIFHKKELIKQFTEGKTEKGCDDDEEEVDIYQMN